MSIRGFICQLLILTVLSVVWNQAPRTGRPYTAPELPAKAPPAGPQGESPVKFANIASTARLNFKQASSSTSVKYLLETMGGGVAVFDYDNDGWEDLLVLSYDLRHVNEVHEAAALEYLHRPLMIQHGDSTVPLERTRLYHNNRDGTFTDLSRSVGLAETALLDDRDLTPTTDLRQLAAAMLYRQFDVPAGAIDNAIFPGLSFDRSAAYLRG